MSCVNGFGSWVQIKYTNIELYSANIGHSEFYLKDMTDMDDDYILN